MKLPNPGHQKLIELVVAEQERSGLSGRKFALQCGLKDTTFRALIKGSVQPSYETLEKLAPHLTNPETGEPFKPIELVALLKEEAPLSVSVLLQPSPKVPGLIALEIAKRQIDIDEFAALLALPVEVVMALLGCRGVAIDDLTIMRLAAKVKIDGEYQQTEKWAAEFGAQLNQPTSNNDDGISDGNGSATHKHHNGVGC